jgi:hypothetical protein
MAEEVEHLSSKRQALSSNLVQERKKERKEREGGREREREKENGGSRL